MPVGYLFTSYVRDIDNNSLIPEDWEYLIYSSDFKDEEVLYLIMYARRKYKDGI